METALAGKLPENAVLSHDLLEGAIARAALVTDVEVVEDYPDPLFGGRLASPSLGAGRLAVAAAYLRSEARRPAAVALEDDRQSTPLADPDFLGADGNRGMDAAALQQAAQWMALLILSQFMSPSFEIVNALLPKSREITVRGHFTALGARSSCSAARSWRSAPC